ncbi:MAG: exodeoxyribonuclease VII large subunit [Desulfobacterales bacterium]|nr:exodeoxyribonuclease VII large subunit [Desulfobacterales bacterium]
MEEADYCSRETPGPRARIHTVSTLTEEIRSLLETHFEFVWVEGEISNFRAPTSGHFYMSLKDEKTQIRAVMFRMQARCLRFVPEDGMKIIAQGRVAVYEPRGEYQLVLDYIEPLGVGALALAFEQLKKKLAAQGLFDQVCKKPLPYLPQRVAVVTSPTGAAIRDFLRVIRRRFSNLEIVIVPVKVQGEGAAAEIASALRLVNGFLDVDVIVLTRGGGSLEDLWAFNEEEVALAIHSSGIPVVSAVGHEIDLTISDLVADLRAPTPSAAAELLVVEKELLQERIREMQGRLLSAANSTVVRLQKRMEMVIGRMRDPRRRVADLWMRLDEIGGRLTRCATSMVREKRNRLHSEMRALAHNAPVHRIGLIRQRIGYQERSMILLVSGKLKELGMNLSRVEGKLKDVSPSTILARGFSITRKLPEESVLKSATGVEEGSRVRVTLARGELECVVKKVDRMKNCIEVASNCLPQPE